MQREVSISKGFYVSIYEITVEQYRALVDPGRPYDNNRGRRPITGLTHAAAEAFCKKLQEANPGHRFRLLTEAEWEYSCSGEPTHIRRLAWGREP